MMTIKLTENDITRLVKKVLKEREEVNYMFFSNLQQIKRQCDTLLDMDRNMIDQILQNGHDWADDHVTEAKVNMDQVFDFIMNEKNKEDNNFEYEEMNEGKKNVATNQKLWKQSLAWARERYDVCPSAYCNGAAVKRYNSKGGKWRKK
jgi:predicted RND superfamily exporter protein